jgi:hypothetical protein
MGFIWPSKQKFLILFWVILFLIIFVAFFFFINERDMASLVVIPLLSPVVLLDQLGFAFPSSCDFICLPTKLAIFSTLVIDLIILYLISCTIYSFRRRGVKDAL